MNQETKKILTQWQLLENGGELRRAASVERVLWFAGLGLCIFIVFAVHFKLHSAFVAVAAAAMGYMMAERNSLRNQLALWPIFKIYIDWKRVEEDLRGSHDQSPGVG